MTNLIESSTWESGIYQLETDDPTLGGQPGFNMGEPVTGHANAQAQQLANRTKYLKDTQEAFVSDLANSTDPAKGAGMVGYIPVGTGAVPLSVYAKLDELRSVADKGASAVAVGSVNRTAIQAAIDEGSVKLLRANGYAIDSSLKYRSERAIEGVYLGFSGSVIRPSGDFPVLVGHEYATAWTRISFNDFMIDGTANTSAFAVQFNQCYLIDVDRVWLRNCYKGISITNSDSLTFKGVLVMEDCRSEAVVIGDNARSLRFFGCNFETSGSHDGVRGSFKIDGYGATPSSAELHGCQFERSRLSVVSGSAKMFGGKFADGSIVLWPMSQASVVESDLYGSTVAHDFGWGNRIVNAYCQNMATPLHKWPDLPMADASASAPTFGAAGDEYVYLVSAGARSSAGVTNGVIEIREGAAIKSTSPTFSIAASGTSAGMSERSAFSFLSVVKNTAEASGPVVTNANIFGIKGGKNLLTNGTFDGGASTGWSFVNAACAASGDDILITPSGANWGIYQDFGAKLTQGKRYIAVAKFSGAASLTWGDSWDGSAGSRVLSSSGVSDLYGDGDTIAMLSFEYYASIKARLSLGRVGSSEPVTVRWIAIIECP